MSVRMTPPIGPSDAQGRQATVELKQARQPNHLRCFNVATNTIFYVARSRQDSCLDCLTPHGGPDADYVGKIIECTWLIHYDFYHQLSNAELRKFLL